MPPAEIVYIHGMAGGRLARADGKTVWPGAGGSLAEDLRGALNPAGHIKFFHRPAAWYWRRRGFAVHEFAYDWRQSLDDSAARLREFIAALAAPRLLIAAHSMGGCVAARCSALFPDAAARVERAYFFGVPLGGTFCAVEVLRGEFLLPRLVASASPFRRRQVLHDLSRAAAAMPGLVDLLPDPALFPSAAPLYDSSNWPEQAAPAQALLDRSLALKRELPHSPILARTVILAGSNWRTPGGVRGDMVTPIASAAPLAGMTVHPLRFPHAALLFEPSGLRAVISGR